MRRGKRSERRQAIKAKDGLTNRQYAQTYSVKSSGKRFVEVEAERRRVESDKVRGSVLLSIVEAR